jgi:hypothetical protein
MSSRFDEPRAKAVRLVGAVALVGSGQGSTVAPSVRWRGKFGEDIPGLYLSSHNLLIFFGGGRQAMVSS